MLHVCENVTMHENLDDSGVYLFIYLFFAACTQEEVNKVMDSAKAAQKAWAKTPLWKRAELLHKAAAILKEHKAPIAECLVKEIAKPAKDAVTEVHIVSWVLGYKSQILFD